MASSKALVALLVLLLNLIFFSCVSSSSIPSSSSPRTSHHSNKCPKDTLKFGVCGDWLNGLVHEAIGAQPSSKCCSLVEGIADLEVADCLCTAIKANVLGVLQVKIPVALSLLVNSCGKKLPQGFQCA